MGLRDGFGLGVRGLRGTKGVGGCPGREDALAKSQDRRDPEKRGSAGQTERTSSCLKLPEEGRIKAAEAGGPDPGSPGDPGFRRGLIISLLAESSAETRIRAGDWQGGGQGEVAGLDERLSKS